MKLIIQPPKRALNKAFLKQRPLRSEIDLFKVELTTLLDCIDSNETEEFHKNLVSDFLKKAIYKDNNFINTKGRQDLVIHNGKDNKTQVGVIIEAKRPNNKADWFTPENPNGKALHELVLYYLRERIECNNIDIKYLVATNINEWYIFEASYFENLFYRDKKFVKQYEEWRDGKKVTKDTNLFYNDIAKPFIESLSDEIPCTYFNIQDYEKTLKSENKEDDKNLIALFKILSPYHLLKVPFTNDSNELDQNFYKELLHIIGLEEAKEGGKTIIRRKSENKNVASLLEMAIHKIKTKGIHKITDAKNYGETSEEQYFNIALELCITWINRILFLKLLEGQLVKYNKGDKKYFFLNNEMIHDFDELFKLFHNVLAVNIKDREAATQKKYSLVPYLNSSLFEISELEDITISIDSLDNSEILDFIGTTILKENKKKNNKLKTLDYLFQFLDSYDFASEDSEDIQDDNKKLINASVLGKVFEKINGYKDGSIYTPGFITMYMCRQSIRLAVVQKFNDIKKWNVKNLDELYEKIEDKKEANNIINDLKICDIAVGSGHFLVSALNEIIAIKSELKILIDKNGKRLKEYTAEVLNDELTISDEDGDIIEYNPQNKESQRLQETLFNEKQTIIENCLFGVDINPNSVKICRLRLWIELLKNAYYKEDTNFTELETLPNIDINIKCGNSLLSRFPLDADLSKALKSIKYDMKAYRGFVNEYKNVKSREVKRGLQIIIDTIKSDFRIEIYKNDPKVIALNKKGGELYNLLNQTKLFKEDEKQKKIRIEKQEKLETEIKNLTREIEEIKTNAIYKNAFEWRFEFPEILNNNGDFEGFDLIIGNPPYFSISTNEKLKNLSDKYETYSQTGDIYSLFYELANNLQKINGIQALIISNKWMRANYGINLRNYILKKSNPLLLIDFGQNLIFDNAIVHTNIIISKRSDNKNELSGVRFEDNKFFEFVNNFGTFVEKNKIKSIQFGEGPWNIIDNKMNLLKLKIETNATPLKDWDIKINFGLKTGLNEAFIIDGKKSGIEINRGILTGLNEAFIINGNLREYILKHEPQSEKFIKPILRGRDTRRYYAEYKNYYIINIPKGYTIKSNKGNINIVMESPPRYGNMEFDNAWDWFHKNHPVLAEYLLPFKSKAEQREDKGDYWWELRACSYIEAFEKPKIIFSEIVSNPQFYYDEQGYYPEATVFFISGNHLKYLTALLNSKAVTYFFKSFYMGGELVGKIRYKKVFLEQTPIPIPNEKQEKQMNDLVDKIILQKQQGKDSKENEKKIDELVYKLYDLTEEEIKIVEN